MRIVAKFGGSSLADASQFDKVINIVRSNPNRSTIVVSAPGKRHIEDRKITDMLYELSRLHNKGYLFADGKEVIAKRYLEIAQALGLRIDIRQEMAEIDHAMCLGVGKDYL